MGVNGSATLERLNISSISVARSVGEQMIAKIGEGATVAIWLPRSVAAVKSLNMHDAEAYLSAVMRARAAVAEHYCLKIFQFLQEPKSGSKRGHFVGDGCGNCGGGCAVGRERF